MSELVRQTPNLTGADRIRLERERQVNSEYFTAEKDDKFKRGELRRAGMCYELAALNDNNDPMPPRHWPLDPGMWKPNGILRNLEKSGALFQADLDRVRRKNDDKANEAIIKYLENRVQQIADEIDRFLAPFHGPSPDDTSTGEGTTFATINEMNVEFSPVGRMLEEAKKRQPLPLYYEAHLRRKLAVRKLYTEANPNGSIMTYQEICTCDSGHLCEHRLEWLIEYLKRANINLNARAMEAQATIDVLQLQVEDLRRQLEEFINPEGEELEE